MNTITMRLPEDLKARIAQVVQQSDSTAHAFIIEAIAEKTTLAERRADFDAVAEQRYAAIIDSGKPVSWSDMHRHLLQRVVAAGTDAETSTKPRAQSHIR